MKAFEQPRSAITLLPATSFAEKRYTFATCDANSKLITPAAGAATIGVVQTPGIANEPCNIMTAGVSFITLGGTVAPGQEVETDANGAAIVLTTGKSAGICLVGGAAGAIGSVLLH